VLVRGLGAGLSVYAARAMPLTRMLEAAHAQGAAAPDARVLVAVFLPGGCDLLSTIVPVNDYGRYADLRGALKIDNPPALGATGLGLHPALSEGANGGVHGLSDAGKVGWLPGIDYANPDLSHFHSRHFWETGLITQADAPGWLGRWLDRHGSPDNPLQGLSLDSNLSPVMRSARAPVAALTSPRDAQLGIRDVWGTASDLALQTWGRIASARPSRPGPASAYTAAWLAKDVGDRLAPYAAAGRNNDPLEPPVPYPDNNDLGKRLSRLAALLALPLGIRVATVDADGEFDTHDNQPEDLDKGLREVSAALAAFQADLEARGIADRVLTLVWSEFGRRPKANDSDGTDHGAGGVAWVQGTRATSGVLSDYPSLSQLDREDNLAVTIDFRAVYASLLEGWLGTDAGEVIPNARAFGRLPLAR
jgi:uncharacterized protein (DUF1501 family)